MKKTLKLLENIDPAKIGEYSKEELIEIYCMARDIKGVAAATGKAIGEEILDRLKGDAEVVGDYSVTRVKRRAFRVKLEKAKELGATKTVVDQKVLGKLAKKGVEIPGSYEYSYPLIKHIKKNE